jgi:hypothetical protein
MKISPSFSSLAPILNQNKLTTPNYIVWKCNLYIVLMVEGQKLVLTQTCLDFPTIDAFHKDHQRYDRWHKSTKIEKCYILATVSNVLQYQMQDM